MNLAALVVALAATPVTLPEPLDMGKLIKLTELACPVFQQNITPTSDPKELVDRMERVLIRLDLKPSEQEIVFLACGLYLRGYLDADKRR